MTERRLAEATAGDRLLLKWSGPARIGLESGSADLALRGEVEVRFLTAGAPSWAIELVRMGLGGPLEGEALHPVVGEIGISGTRGGQPDGEEAGGRGEIRPVGDGRWSFDLALNATVLYSEIESRWGFEALADDLLMPPLERFRGRLTGVIAKTETAGQGRRLELTSGSLGLGRVGAARGSVAAITAALAASAAVLPTARAVDDCGPARASSRRTLRIRPVFFCGPDGRCSGDPLREQLEEARRVWQKCCVHFADLPPVRVPENRVDLTNLTAISASHIEAGVIEIFMIAQDVGFQPQTLSPGMGLDRILLPERQAKPRTLAHELGHVLSGVHPGKTPLGHQWVGAVGSLLDPGHVGDGVSLANCGSCHNVHLDTDVGLPCCFGAEEQRV